MAAAAALSTLTCPLRRSTRLAHAHHPHSNLPTKHRIKQRIHPPPDPDPDQDSSSSDPENELTPRALRALKRQRLALDLDGLPFSARARPRKRRKDNIQRPSDPPPLTFKHPNRQARRTPPVAPSDSCHSSHSTATFPPTCVTPIPEPINDPSEPASSNDNRLSFPSCSPPALHNDPSAPFKPELSIPLPSISPASSVDSSTSPPLTPLTPLTPSPESSPSLPGHDRQVLPPTPLHDPLPPPISLETLPIPSPPEPASSPSTDSFTPSTTPMALNPALDTLIPFDGLHPQFGPELSVQIPHPPTTPQLQGLELQDQFHSFPAPQLYVPPNPVFARDREINIWKLACQERVDCLLRRYGIDYIKALVESEARAIVQETLSTGTPSGPAQTKFRLYTPASYTYSSTSWGSSSGSRKAFPIDEEGDDTDAGWPMDDGDWVDADVDMEDEDEEDYEDDDEAGEEHEPTLEAVEALVIADPPRDDTQAIAMEVDSVPVDQPRSDPRSELPRPSTPQPFPLPPSLPPLSSLHVPLLSEPPRAFMGRGTPPDRRRLTEWSGTGRAEPLYLAPVPQRPNVDVPMSVQPQPTHGEWTSFLYSMLEGEHASEAGWYELELAGDGMLLHGHSSQAPAPSQPPVPHAQGQGRTPADIEDSSTLRFALG